MSDPAPPGTAGPTVFPRARAIFESALESPAAERPRVVQDACGGDAALLAVVQQMLGDDVAPHALLDGTPSLQTYRWQAGDTFAGHFRIVELIGVGGMGEVYRAHDATLGRDVALKVLPSAIDGSGALDDRLARFQREAQVLAGLNHPNIATIHGFESDGGIRALVLELVEGSTLADRIAAGPVPLDEVVPIARQIAASLEAAHEQGVVHRDLKPANVKLRPDGTVKLLDFGLAKVAQPDVVGRSTISSSPTTLTSPSMIQSGVLLGTAAYMSPEQAKGRDADRRSDVWAFGAVLYEMLSGVRAFEGDDIPETLAAVLRSEIDWTRLPLETPPALRHVLARCLDRDSNRRLRDIGEARIALDDIAAGVSRPVPAVERPPVRSPWWGRASIAAAGALAAGTAVAAVLWSSKRPVAMPVTRMALSMSSANTLLLDSQSRDLTITRDGTRVVYKGGPRVDRTQLFAYALDQLEPQPLTGPAQPKGPFASPDGRWIGFFEPAVAGAVLKKVAIAGGPPLEVSKLDGPSRGATWTDDDTIIAASGAPATGLLRISPSGGAPTVLTRPNRQRGESDHLYPSALPGGRSILFTITSIDGGMDVAQVALLDLASGTWKTVIRGASQAEYVPSGHLVYVAGGALWAVAFDTTRGETLGQAAVVVPQIVTLPTGAAEFAVATDGTLAYVARGGAIGRLRTLVWVDRQGRETPIAAPPRPYANVRLSPDGTRVAMEVEDQEQDVWVWHLGRETLTRVTTDPGLDETPIWTRDGRRLVFTSQTGGVLGSLFWQAADGTGHAEPLAPNQLGIVRAMDVLPDGSGVVFGDGLNVMRVPLDGSGQVTTLQQVPGRSAVNGAVSPDGRWLAYIEVGAGGGTPQIFVSGLSSSNEGRTQVTPSGGWQPRWAANGRELFYLGLDGALMSVPVTTGATLTTGAPSKLLAQPYYVGQGLSAARSYDVAADGQRFLMLKQAATPDQPNEPATVVVVKNWAEELKRLVPVSR